MPFFSPWLKRHFAGLCEKHKGVFTLQINEVLILLPKNKWQITLKPPSPVGTPNSTYSGTGRICFVGLIAPAAPLPLWKHGWLMPGTDWHRGPFPQPGLEQLSNGDACSLSCTHQHGKLKSSVREWRVPGCSGQRRFNLDRMCSKDRTGMYICVRAHAALTVLLAETSRTHLSPQQSCEAVLSSCEIIPARLPK